MQSQAGFKLLIVPEFALRPLGKFPRLQALADDL
jgi:hypothetical protein